MALGFALVILTFVAALCARLFGAMRGAVVLTLLLVVAGMSMYKFVDSGGAFLLVLSFAIPVVMAAIGLGTAAGTAMSRGENRVGLVLLAIPVVIWLWSVATNILEKQNEQKAVRFVRSHPEVIAKVGDSGRMYPTSTTTSGGGSLPTRYEYSLNDRYIIVDVAYDFWMPKFSLACITNIPPGQRNAFGDVCKQKPVEPVLAVDPQPADTSVSADKKALEEKVEAPKPQPPSQPQPVATWRMPQEDGATVNASGSANVAPGTVHVIAVYQAQGAGGNHGEGTIQIGVGTRATPVTLVLSSYEPVHWQIQADPGADIAKVVVMGYFPGRASGISQERVQRVSGYLSDYRNTNDGASRRLHSSPSTADIVEKMVGRRPDSVDGAYESNYFSVESIRVPPAKSDPSAPAWSASGLPIKAHKARRIPQNASEDSVSAPERELK